jgi:CRP-like cAMP-binding protein
MLRPPGSGEVWMSEKMRKQKEDAARLMAKGQWQEACEVYEKVVRGDTRDLAARQKLAELYGRLGKTERAVHLYQSVAGSYAADGLMLKAIAVCKIILQLDPTHTETQAILAELSTRRRGAATELVQMPKAMSEAIAKGEKKAVTSAGASAPPTPLDDDDHLDDDPPPLLLPTPLRRPQTTPPSPPPADDADGALEASLNHTLGDTLGGARAPETTIEIDLEDVGAEPVVLGQAEAAEIARRSAPLAREPSDLRLSFGLSDFDPLLVLTADDIPDAPSVDDESVVALDDVVDEPEVVFDESDDDDGQVIELMPAFIDVDKIAPIPLFYDLPRDAFMALTERMELRLASVDEALITEGEGGDTMFIIIQGRVKVCRRGEDGAEVVLAELQDGAFFGEMALLSDAPRTASVVCTEETMLFSISRELVADMTSRYPTVGEVMRRFHKNRLITNLLQTSPLFSPFSVSDKKTLIERFKSRQVDEGTFLITREKPGEALYVVLSGRCEVLDVDHSGREVVLAELKDGDVFGEMSMLWNKATCASVRATTTCSVMRLAKADFSEIIMTHPQLLETLAAMSESRTKKNRERLGVDVAL